MKSINKKGFTFIESLAGIAIASWVILGCYTLLAGALDTSNRVLSEYDSRTGSLNNLIQQIESDIGRATTVCPIGGRLLINNDKFIEKKWRSVPEFIPTNKPNSIFELLKRGYRQIGKILSVQFSYNVQSLLVLGNANRVISYYEIQKHEDSENPHIEIIRSVGDNITNRLRTSLIRKMKLSFNHVTGQLILSEYGFTETIQNHVFLLPFAPS